MNTDKDSVAGRRRNRLAWIASILLAVVVVCAGCFMLFAFALTAQGELHASLLGSEWRVWPLQEETTSGLGVSQTSPSQGCRHTRAWLIMWRPSLKIEVTDYDDCGARSAPSPVANARQSAIIAFAGAEP